MRNLNLAGAQISANPAAAFPQAVGALAGQNDGQIVNVTVSGSIDGNNLSSVTAGGLVGRNNGGGTITNAHASVNVEVGNGTSGSGWNYAGGLVGVSSGTINSSSAGATVVGGNFSFVGGLVGQNNGTITSSVATAEVSGTSSANQGDNSTAVGGFAGANSGTIADSFAFGNVSGDGPGSTVILGGFVGLNGLTGNLPNPPTGLITNSEAHGSVAATGDGQAGGFVGGNFAAIQSSRAFGSVSAEGGNAGGFVGMNFDPGSINDSFAVGNVAVGTPGNFDDVTAGGFAGENEGVISNSKASGAVNGVAEVQTLGGFVGANNGVIESASASGNVTGNGSAITIAGGFAGGNALGEILESSASGSVSATGPLAVAGGFIGLNIGHVGPSFATGNVDVSGAQFGFGGGFAGWNLAAIGRSFATGAVTGGENSFLGGFASLNLGEIFQAYATSPTTGGANSTVGGLLALNFGTVDQTYATGLVSAGNGSRRGGLVAANDYTAFLGVLPQDAQQLFANTLPTGTATNSYWDTQSTGQTTSAGGEGRTTAQLVNGLPPGFSTDVWTIKAGQSYPFFNGQSDPIPTPRDHFVQGDVNQAQYLNNVQLTAYQNQNPTVTPPVVTLPKGRAGKKGAGNKPNPGNNNQQFRPDGRPSNIPPLNETRFIANQVLVQIGANVPPAVLDRVVRQLGLKVVSTQTVGLLGTRMIQFEFGKGKNIRAVIKELEKQRIIDEATPNYEFELAQDATAPAGNGSGDPAQYVIGKLRLAEAHRLATGENVLVAVIDSEIDAKHPDIDGRIAARYEEAGPVEKPHPHGTGMAGAIVSHRKLMGTAPGARILAIRAFGGATGGAKGTTVQIVKGLDWAVGQHARIVNMSFAGPKDPTLARAFKAAFDKGVVLIAAAGNAGPKSPPLYPGADPSVIAVSATDADDKIYANSNRGSYVTVASPGVDILVPAPEGGYEFTTGTSVAAAHVSGIAALLLQRDPKLDAAGVREILTTTANPLGSSGRSNEFGYGLVDPLKALQVAGAKTSGLPTPATVAAAGR